MKKYKGWIYGLLVSLILLSGSVGASAALSNGTDPNYEYLSQPVSEISSIKIIEQGLGLGIQVNYKNNEIQYPDNREAVWNSSNPMVATVNKKGVVTGTGLPGQARISAQIGSKKSEWIAKVDCQLVANSNDFDRPDKSEVEIQLYNNFVTYIPFSGDMVDPTVFKWTSSNSQVATVDEKAKVIFTGRAGKATITGTYQNLKVYIPVQYQSEFCFYIQQECATTAQAVGYFVSDKNVVEPEHDKFTYQTSNPSVVTIDKNGFMKFTGRSGKFRITARYQGVAAYFDSEAIFVSALSDYIDYMNQEQKVSVLTSSPFQQEIITVDNSKVTWKSSNKKIATVDTNGVVRFTGVAGSVTITAVYLGQNLSQTVEVPVQ